MPDVVVVVPTTGRPELVAAVSSALAQTRPAHRVVVVVDGGDVDQVRRTLSSDHRVEVLNTDPSLTGGNAARMLGANSGSEPLIAFLDDDDLWHPSKLQVQLELLAAMPGTRRVVSCRVEVLTADGLPTGVRYPRRLVQPGQDIAGYLFDRREVRYGEALLHTSTLLCDRQVLDTTPWRLGLVRHQDWDWILSVAQVPGTRFAMSDEALTGVRASSRSVSAAGSWRSSAAWVASREDCLNGRQRADFLLAHTTPLAVRTGGRLEAVRVITTAFRTGRPGGAALLQGLGSLAAPARFRDGAASRKRQSGPASRDGGGAW